MKIASSQVSLGASSQKKVEAGHTKSLSIWGNRKSIQLNSALRQDTVQISRKAQQLLAASQTQGTGDPSTPADNQNTLKARLLEEFIFQLTGRHYRIGIKQFNPSQTGVSQPATVTQQGAAAPGWGVTYHREDYYAESEQMSFAGSAVVKTADGRQISVNLNVNYSRSFVQSSSFDLKAGSALTDPLVINFDGSGEMLSDKTVSFDLDMDGKKDNIAAPAAGSGFLAIDKNGNGRIDDGSELLGPATDDGFSELAALDGDHNGWIDENDAAFSQLRIWSVDDSGNSTLFTLAGRGVGAIYAGGTDADFSFKDGENAVTGQVRQMGMFLYENGGAGAVGELDLAV